MGEYSVSTQQFDSSEELYQVNQQRTRKVKLTLCGMFVSVMIAVSPVDYSAADAPSYGSEVQVEYVVGTHSSISMADIRGEQRMLLSSVYDKAREGLNVVATLQDNWDGFGASAPSEKVISNVRKLISAMEISDLMCCGADDIEATPYGTIVFDVNTDAGLVSAEIGETMLGFFTDFKNGHNYASEGIETNFESVPNELAGLLS